MIEIWKILSWKSQWQRFGIGTKVGDLTLFVYLTKVKGIHSSSVDFKEFFNILSCGKEKENMLHITFEAIITEAMIEGSVNVSRPL